MSEVRYWYQRVVHLDELIAHLQAVRGVTDAILDEASGPTPYRFGERASDLLGDAIAAQSEAEDSLQEALDELIERD